MLNAETPRLKFALYGAHSSLGSAVLCELLSRQHEAVALLNDCNSIPRVPGCAPSPATCSMSPVWRAAWPAWTA